jgi:CelD/BcsL family acetyltransferase involved in cellulose biosynthesis
METTSMTSARTSDDEADGTILAREPPDRDPRGGGIDVRELSLVEAVPLRTPWNELLARAVEPDIMHGPDFLVPALEIFAPDARLLVAHRGVGAARRLVAVMALWSPRLGFGLTGRLPTVFSNEFAPLGTPLVDADRPDEILAALLAAIARADGGVVFRHLPLDGPFAATLERVAAVTGHRLTIVESHSRACLRGGADGDAFFKDHIRPKRRKEWRRQWRRLVETGPVRGSIARGPDARAAFADFLVLEASGWKGRRQTALVQNAAVMRFAERVVDGLADAGHVVVDRIDRAGQPLAMLVSFGAEGHWVSWKTAYDEAFAAFSPGAQVLLRATTRFLDAGELIEIDSLAVEDHPLMNHVWPDRRRIGTVVVGFAAPRRPPLRVRAATFELRLYLAARRLARRLRQRIGR